MNLSRDFEFDKFLDTVELDYMAAPSLSDLVGAVTSPTIDTKSTEGLAPHEGSHGALRPGESPCQELSPCDVYMW